LRKNEKRDRTLIFFVVATTVCLLYSIQLQRGALLAQEFFARIARENPDLVPVLADRGAPGIGAPAFQREGSAHSVSNIPLIYISYCFAEPTS
jgi:hypothetical protein